MAKQKNWHSISEYYTFRAVMQAGTTTGAAQRLGISQSAVSRALANLEARLGLLLFEREAGRLRPTREASGLNLRLDPLFEALDRIDDSSPSVQETLRLIAPPTYAHRFLISQITSFLSVAPQVFINLEVNTSEEIIRAIMDDRCDLGLTGIEQSRAEIKLIPYRTSQAVCVMGHQHPLAQRASIQPQDLHGQPLVAISRRHARRGQLERLLHQAQAEPRLVAEVSTSFAAADLVKEGLGLAVINPFPLYHYRSDNLAFVPFDSPIVYRSYFVVSATRPVPRAARAFMRHLRLNTPPDPFSSKLDLDASG